MNIGEANAVNDVLRFVLDDTNDSEGRLQQACELLAEKANKTLGAGIRPEDVRAAFGWLSTTATAASPCTTATLSRYCASSPTHR
jgi:hypothetical protein